MFDVAQIKLNQQKHIADMKASCRLSIDFATDKYDSFIEEIFTDFPTIDSRVQYWTMQGPIDVINGYVVISRAARMRVRSFTANSFTSLYKTNIIDIIESDLKNLKISNGEDMGILYDFAMYIPMYVVQTLDEETHARPMLHYARKVSEDTLWPLKKMIKEAEAAYV